ncbi:MAG: NTP transferase domain-containing protein [Xanthomonadales bacterium]|nr:NTP transferase domain-containing protein [Xanthomonadales bacterium]NIN60527.1 NTP transferase domain-containing protein [Xanthomonadales bacterium]NIN75882.1 NTP transferase domain-containing protein [Xanthomonadales bacterium]NIO15272.1 NTP transferase domain-containing protein [Xanthomonadales bacterium]NIP12920.1 NTP transferase domain-containing protein [Xanthomonadales bacterium]
MRAIVLAAGRGERLAASNPDGHPKCLLQIGGRTLLARQLGTLNQLGINRVDLVVGYEADRLIEHVGSLTERPPVSFLYNPRFLAGSVLSLLAAADILQGGEPTLLMDADVLFHPDILRRLLQSAHANCLLLDREFIPGDEPVKIAVANGIMIEFRKQLPPGLVFDQLGESVGFFRFDASTSAAVAAACARYEAEGLADAPHEEALRDVLLSMPGRFGFEDITGLPWVEVDFAEDVERAEREVLPAIRDDVPGY